MSKKPNVIAPEGLSPVERKKEAVPSLKFSPYSQHAMGINVGWAPFSSKKLAYYEIYISEEKPTEKDYDALLAGTFEGSLIVRVAPDRDGLHDNLTPQGKRRWYAATAVLEDGTYAAPEKLQINRAMRLKLCIPMLADAKGTPLAEFIPATSKPTAPKPPPAKKPTASKKPGEVIASEGLNPVVSKKGARPSLKFLPYGQRPVGVNVSWSPSSEKVAYYEVYVCETKPADSDMGALLAGTLEGCRLIRVSPDKDGLHDNSTPQNTRRQYAATAVLEDGSFAVPEQLQVNWAQRLKLSNPMLADPSAPPLMPATPKAPAPAQAKPAKPVPAKPKAAAPKTKAAKPAPPKPKAAAPKLKAAAPKPKAGQKQAPAKQLKKLRYTQDRDGVALTWAPIDLKIAHYEVLLFEKDPTADELGTIGQGKDPKGINKYVVSKEHVEVIDNVTAEKKAAYYIVIGKGPDGQSYPVDFKIGAQTHARLTNPAILDSDKGYVYKLPASLTFKPVRQHALGMRFHWKAPQKGAVESYLVVLADQKPSKTDLDHLLDGKLKWVRLFTLSPETLSVIDNVTPPDGSSFVGVVAKSSTGDYQTVSAQMHNCHKFDMEKHDYLDPKNLKWNEQVAGKILKEAVRQFTEGKVKGRVTKERLYREALTAARTASNAYQGWKKIDDTIAEIEKLWANWQKSQNEQNVVDLVAAGEELLKKELNKPALLAAVKNVEEALNSDPKDKRLLEILPKLQEAAEKVQRFGDILKAAKRAYEGGRKEHNVALLEEAKTGFSEAFSIQTRDKWIPETISKIDLRIAFEAELAGCKKPKNYQDLFKKYADRAASSEGGKGEGEFDHSQLEQALALRAAEQGWGTVGDWPSLRFYCAQCIVHKRHQEAITAYQAARKEKPKIFSKSGHTDETLAELDALLAKIDTEAVDTWAEHSNLQKERDDFDTEMWKHDVGSDEFRRWQDKKDTAEQKRQKTWGEVDGIFEKGGKALDKLVS